MYTGVRDAARTFKSPSQRVLVTRQAAKSSGRMPMTSEAVSPPPDMPCR